jgi:integrase/recombinase XerD
MATSASRAAGIKNLREAWKAPKDGPGLTWDEALASFLQSRQLGINGAHHAVKPRTIEEYKWDLRVFFDFVKSLRLTHYNQLTEKVIQNYVAFLQSPDRGKGGWGKATQRKYLISLKAFFRWVELDETCQDVGMQPFFKSLPRIGKAIRREFIPSQEQMDKFRDGFDRETVWGMRDWTAVTLMLRTGARIGEICNLEPDDFYWDVGLVNLDGKTGKRLVPFDPSITGRSIQQWLSWREKYVHGDCKKVFISRYGGACIPNTFSQSFADNLRKTGLDKELGENTISAHTIRHFFCTMFLVHGGVLHILQQITGHKDLNTLMTYVNLSNQMTSVRSELDRVSPLNFMSKGAGVEKKKRITVRL